MQKPRLLAGAPLPLLLAAGILGVASSTAHAACNLGNGIKRVVHLTFDNVHLRRDNPNVPSDLEQMPNLFNFMLTNGTVSGNHYTPLISHTANDIITALTGVYPDRAGVPIANSYRVFDSNGHPSGSHPSFIYWTATDPTDGKPVMVNENGKTAPAPWVPFTRAGCDFGAYSVANMEFETLPGDIGVVYGTTSNEFQTVVSQLASSDPATKQRPNTDWLGIAIHCAQGSPLCGNGKPDLLPDEPGPNGQPGPNQYLGFNALYGNINVQPAISPSGPIKDLDGNVITDAFGHPGFPNVFSPSATQSLGYVATLLEAGVQVVYFYIADAHDSASGAGAFGPGEAGYVAQLQAYDRAWGQFFARLAARGIDKTNTLFIFTSDENDHFVGGAPTPATCDGVTTPCTYFYPNTTTRSVGELTSNLDSILRTQRGNLTPFLVHSDDAPNIYIDGNPGPTSPVTRQLELDMAALTWVNPLPGKNNQVDQLAQFIADRAEMQLLHMVTTSPARTPSFTMFGNPDYFFQTTKGSLPLAPQDCGANPSLCVAQGNAFAWNHGDVQQEIVQTWFGMVGPGVRQQGRDDSVFSDHTDLRPTLLLLAGLKDDYISDGRVLIEKLQPGVLPGTIDPVIDIKKSDFIQLAQVYKQLNAPLGQLGKSSLALATQAITGPDTTYAFYLSQIGPITTQRDQLAAQIKQVLNAAEFGNGSLRGFPVQGLIAQATNLINQVGLLQGLLPPQGLSAQGK
jgi:hypothetical protein